MKRHLILMLALVLLLGGLTLPAGSHPGCGNRAAPPPAEPMDRNRPSSRAREGPPPIAIYFSPQGGIEQAIVQTLDAAEREIWVAMYSFTSVPLADALVRAERRGVSVRLLLDEGQRIAPGSRARGRQSGRLIEAGLDVRFEDTRGLLHHKFAVIDGRTVVSGSYNWTHNAEYRNAENLTLIRSPQVAARFRDEFLRLAQRLP